MHKSTHQPNASIRPSIHQHRRRTVVVKVSDLRTGMEVLRFTTVDMARPSVSMPKLVSLPPPTPHPRIRPRADEAEFVDNDDSVDSTHL
jgi:hypothetical protein